MFRILSTALVAAMLVACATPIPPSKLEDPTASLTAKIASPETVEVAYRRIVQGARACLTDALWKIDADYFPDIREGSILIQFAQAGSGLQVPLTSIKLIRVDGSGSSATMRYFKTTLGDGDGHSWIVRSTREWLTGNAKYCSYERL